MRIVSKFHDYYDSCRVYGADPKLIYIRKTEEIDISWNLHHEKKQLELLEAIKPLTDILKAMPCFSRIYRINDDLKGIIAFCGRAYPFYRLDNYHYTFEKVLQCIENQVKESTSKYLKETLEHLNRTPTRPYKCDQRHSHLNKDSWKYFSNETDLNLPDSVHAYLKSPVIAIENKTITINPMLSKYNFASQIDPFTAYQELSMYIGNNLATQMDPEINISDEIRAESKGFDKWSFRTKISKKPRGKKNKC